MAGAGHHAAAVELLLEAMRTPDWVAEEPEVHLVPHIREALAAPGAALQVDGFETAANGELVVRLRDSRPADQRSPAGLRAAAFRGSGSGSRRHDRMVSRCPQPLR